MHDRLVRLVLKVAIPALLEGAKRSLLNLLHFFLRRPKLDTGLNSIRGKWASTIGIPLLKDLVLDYRVATNKVIKGLAIRLRAIYGEGEVVVLEIETNTWQVDLRLDACIAELLGIT